MIGFVLFEKFHQRQNIGSSRIRGHWLIKNMEAEVFVQGKDYDTIVFQKVYWKEMARNFKGIKILDICDPDWMDGIDIVALSKEMDAITVPTQRLKEELEQMVECPVHLILDRIDFDTIPKPKKHEGRAKKVVWFGYSNNMEVLDPTFSKLRKMGLTLKIISDATLNTSECSVENEKWKAETVNEEIQKADFVLLPEYKFGRHLYKSNNKTTHSWALGMPVAKTVQDLERFMDEGERTREAEKRLEEVKKYNVKESVKELKKIIKEVKDGREMR